MDKYRQGLAKKFQPDNKKLPINEGQEALRRSQFASIEKERFFNDAYGDILSDIFVQWLKTGHHEKETREYLYATAMALGSVKSKLINIEQFGKNIPFMDKHNPPKQDTQEDKEYASQHNNGLNEGEV